jgi:RNA polymerase sigma-70 factor (ECF subfamily)
MGMRADPGRELAEARFREIFANLGAVTGYARRRGSRDPEAMAAETLTIAWKRLDAVPSDDPRPWLFATARNLLLAEARKARHQAVPEARYEPPPELTNLDPSLAASLRDLPEHDREALFLVAWEDLTPKQAARALGIAPGTFRVRLWRARRHLQAKLSECDGERLPQPHATPEKELT